MGRLKGLQDLISWMKEDEQRLIDIMEQINKEEIKMLGELKLILIKKLDNARNDLANTPSISVKKNILKGQIEGYVDVLATIQMLEDKNNDK